MASVAPRDRLAQTFARLVRVDSPSRREGELARLLVAELEQLGWQVRDDGTGPEAGNVIAQLAGDEGLQPVLFTSHMDVVMPCLGVQPRLEGDVFLSAGDTVLGADAKASMAVLLELARLFVVDEARRPPLELVFTWGEEIGHLGAKALEVDQLRARRAYVLDGLAPVGTIVTAAPTYDALAIRVLGRAAHAGVEPERGLSAITVTAEALRRLPWGRLSEATTANVGTIHGGSVRNAVAAEVRLEAEVRSLDVADAARAVAAIEEVFAAVAAEAGAGAEIDVQQLYVGYELDERGPLVELARRAVADLDGAPARLVRSGGGSDANELNARGLPACVLGIGAEACHSVQERISLGQLELLAAWVQNIVALAAAG